jgi:ParB family chromosome partitioning protein
VQTRTEGGVREIDIGAISPNPDQPRKTFDAEPLHELADSIAQRGVLQPILLRKVGAAYQIIAGERRWRAAQLARLHSIPAIVREFDETTTAEVALIENLQREDLKPLEEAEAYRALMQAHGHTQDAVAKLVHKSRSHVANLLRLNDLSENVKALMNSGALSMGAARALIGVADADAIASAAVAKGWSVREIEDHVRQGRAIDGQLRSVSAPRGTSERRGKPGHADADIAALERQLGDLLGLKVKVAHKGVAGSVTLQFSNLDQLDLICQRLSGEPI